MGAGRGVASRDAMVRLSKQLILTGGLAQAILLSAFGQPPGQPTLRAGEVEKSSDRRKTAERIDVLITQLGSKKFQEREAASRALEGIGVLAFPALQKAASTDKD